MKRLFLLPLIVCVMLSGSLGVSGCQSVKNGNSKVESADTHSDEIVFGKQDFRKQEDLLKKSQSQKRISDEDVDWVINLSQNGGINRGDAFVRSRVRVRAFSILRYAELTPPQKERVYQVASLVLSSKDSEYSSTEKAAAVNLFGHIGDKRAVPYISALLQDKEEKLRVLASRVLSEDLK